MMSVLMSASRTSKISSVRAVGMPHRCRPSPDDASRDFISLGSSPQERERKPGEENSEDLRSFHDL